MARNESSSSLGQGPSAITTHSGFSRDGMTSADLLSIRSFAILLRVGGEDLECYGRQIRSLISHPALGHAMPSATLRQCVELAHDAHVQLLRANENAQHLAGRLNDSAHAYESAELAAAAKFHHEWNSGGSTRAISAAVRTIGEIIFPDHNITTEEQAQRLAESIVETITRLDEVLPGDYEDVLRALVTALTHRFPQNADATAKLLAKPTSLEAPRAAESISQAASIDGDLYGDPNGASHIHVQRTIDAHGHGSWLVTIPGTYDWSMNSTHGLDAIGNLQAAAGMPTALTPAVLSALRQAQKAEGALNKGEPVMIVGHSQGGIIAHNLGRDAKAQKEFNIKNVVTFGSPVGRSAPGKTSSGETVQELNVEMKSDLVARLDGNATGDGDPGRSRVVIDDKYAMVGQSGEYGIVRPHDITQYGLDFEVARTQDETIQRYERSTKNYFDGEHRTYAFDLRRASPTAPAEPPAKNAKPESAMY